MKGDGRKLDPVLRRLGDVRVVCLYGDDAELVREGARRIVVAVAGTADDPFRVTELDGDKAEPVQAAVGSGSLGGGRRAVWIRHATERLLPVVERGLATAGESLLVLESGPLLARARLRAAIESSPAGCAIACNLQPGGSRNAIRAALQAANVVFQEEVVTGLAARAEAAEWSGAMAAAAAALFAGPGGRLNLSDVEAICGGGADGLDAAVLAGMAGQRAALDAALTEVLADGAGGVGALRAGLAQVQKLRALAGQVERGKSLAEAGRSLRPPLFFRHEALAAAVLRHWTQAQLNEAAHGVWRAERHAKATGVPQDTVSRYALSGLVRAD